MNKNDQEFLVQKIRTQYTEKEHTELDALKELDAKVKRPANVFAYTFGSILGMEKTMMPGIVIGVVGMLMALINYPVYKNMLSSRRKKYASQVMELSDKIMESK